MKHIALPAETYTTILNYLAARPYREVAHLIGRMGAEAKAVDPPVAPEAPTAQPAAAENETQGRE